MVIPQKGELLGRVIKLVGGDNIIVKCTDGKVRTCRIRGKIKRRMWIRDNDLVLIAPWDFQWKKQILFGQIFRCACRQNGPRWISSRLIGYY